MLLSADATLVVADATALAGFTGFTPGSHHLVISDTAQNLLHAICRHWQRCYAVELSQPATLTVADAAALSAAHAVHRHQPGHRRRHAAHLAAMPAALTAFAAIETLVRPTADNASQFVLDAAQLATLLALPNLDVPASPARSPWPTPPARCSPTPPPCQACPTGLAGHVIAVAGSADATVSVSQAEALHALSGFSLNGHSLTISDTACTSPAWTRARRPWRPTSR